MPQHGAHLLRKPGQTSTLAGQYTPRLLLVPPTTFPGNPSCETECSSAGDDAAVQRGLWRRLLGVPADHDPGEKTLLVAAWFPGGGGGGVGTRAPGGRWNAAATATGDKSLVSYLLAGKNDGGRALLELAYIAITQVDDNGRRRDQLTSNTRVDRDS